MANTSCQYCNKTLNDEERIDGVCHDCWSGIENIKEQDTDEDMDDCEDTDEFDDLLSEIWDIDEDDDEDEEEDDEDTGDVK